jgi:hypothetical protein
MPHTVAMRRLARFLTGVLLILATSAVHADPIQPSYTLTDLGSGNPTFSTDASGNGIVVAPNGQTAYPFPQTFTGTLLPGPQYANIPVPVPVPDQPSAYSMGTPFSGAMDATQYPNGTVLFLDHWGWYGFGEYDLYSVQHNPDGTWGAPTILMQGPGFGGPGSDEWGSGVIDMLSKSGFLLMGKLIDANLPQSSLSNWSYTVSNLNTKSATNLATLPALVNNGYVLQSSYYSPFKTDMRILGMDDDGRILLDATHYSNPTDPNSATGQELLLLTPAGVTSDPIIMNAPEPGSWAVMAMALAACAAHRARWHRGRKAV